MLKVKWTSESSEGAPAHRTVTHVSSPSSRPCRRRGHAEGERTALRASGEVGERRPDVRTAVGVVGGGAPPRRASHPTSLTPARSHSTSHSRTHTCARTRDVPTPAYPWRRPRTLLGLERGTFARGSPTALVGPRERRSSPAPMVPSSQTSAGVLFLLPSCPSTSRPQPVRERGFNLRRVLRKFFDAISKSPLLTLSATPSQPKVRGHPPSSRTPSSRVSGKLEVGAPSKVVPSVEATRFPRRSDELRLEVGPRGQMIQGRFSSFPGRKRWTQGRDALGGGLRPAFVRLVRFPQFRLRPKVYVLPGREPRTQTPVSIPTVEVRLKELE